MDAMRTVGAQEATAYGEQLDPAAFEQSELRPFEHWAYEVDTPIRPVAELLQLDEGGIATEFERTPESLESWAGETISPEPLAWSQSPPPGMFEEPVQETTFETEGSVEEALFEAEEYVHHADSQQLADQEEPTQSFAPETEFESGVDQEGLFSSSGIVAGLAGASGSITERIASALRQGFWSLAVQLMITSGVRDENSLTNKIFHARHPELAGRSIRKEETQLAAEWLAIRNKMIRPLISGRRSGARRTQDLRNAWSQYLNAEAKMVRMQIFETWNTPVNPETVAAWKALEQALVASGYRAHRAWVYVPRNIGVTSSASLHAYGLAIDIDHSKPKCNVNRRTPDKRLVRFATATTKDQQCKDVTENRTDTSFTEDQVRAVEAIQTVDGHQVFTWGGRWVTTKDTMHFQINVTPQELARGIRSDSIRRGSSP